MQSSMNRIAICGETYSPNLGDGVIADSLKWLLNGANHRIDVSFADVSCRQDYDFEQQKETDETSWFRRIHRSLSQLSLYRKAAMPLVWYLVKRKKFRLIWQDQVNKCDLLLIGGGQLLMDNDLAFPLKIYELVRLAQTQDKDVVFYACGVSARWSRFGFRLLAQALFSRRVLWVSVRDQRSCDTLRTLFPNTTFECRLSLDPALCAAEAYGIQAAPRSKTIGLGICSPDALSKYTVSKNDYTIDRIKRFWIDLADTLKREGREVVFFTNGQSDDHAFAQSVVTEWTQSKAISPPMLLKRARTPRLLIEQISQCQAIVAHRLHANIIAYSLGIPSVGLIWDPKVREFGNLTQRSRFYLDPPQVTPYGVRESLAKAIRSGIDTVHLAELKKRVKEDVRVLLGTL